MTVIVVSREDRGNGMTEVTLSEDGHRFTAHIPILVADSDNAQATYEEIAANVRASRKRHEAILANERTQ